MTDSSAPTLADRIDAILPQTQCEQCGYHGCRPYAEAIATGNADINQCPPGGQEGIDKLAQLLGTAAKPLNPTHGEAKPRQLARIVEADCIGCTKCIQACPVDAIVGAAKHMHTVIDDRCTGCELCVPACPVDCIALDPMPQPQQDQAHADAARNRFNQREARMARQRAEREERLARRKAAIHARRQDSSDASNAGGDAVSAPLNQSAVQAAIERGRARRRTRNDNAGS